jgi:protein-L-isoaspartate(D-aspartate) O-methyltransferase
MRTALGRRRAFVAELRDKGVICSREVGAAFLAVPREKFIPAVVAEHGLAAVYRDQAHVTKRDSRGMPLSSSSQPALMARMLELLDVRPGQRVLEIGAGTGYNAALLARLTGPDGHITTIDIDPQLVRQARRALRVNGYGVSVVAGDGRDGYRRLAPYDRIIATACADEIPRAWLEQLTDGGLLEVPLRLDRDRSAIQVIPVFERTGDRLVSNALTWGGFMPLHSGDGGWRRPPVTLSASRTGGGRHESLGSLTGQALMRLPESAARALLASVLTAAGRPVKQGLIAMSSAEPPLMLIYLLSRIPDARRIALDTSSRIGIGLVDQRTRSLAIVSTRSPWKGESGWHRRRSRWRLDGFGGEAAAAELADHLEQWARLSRRGRPRLQITASGSARALRLSYEWSAR